MLEQLTVYARQRGVTLPFSANTPYVNTISAAEQTFIPGNPEIERRIKSLARWNALAMVVRANRHEEGIGGHISTYASAATLFEVASIISSARKTKSRTEISSTFRGTRRQACMRERFSKGG